MDDQFAGSQPPNQDAAGLAPNAEWPGHAPEPQPEAGKTAGELQAENADLRAQLEAENDQLRERLAASQASNLDAQGFTDEDVRRLERPSEFADEPEPVAVGE